MLGMWAWGPVGLISGNQHNNGDQDLQAFQLVNNLSSGFMVHVLWPATVGISQMISDKWMKIKLSLRLKKRKKTQGESIHRGLVVCY